jgi:type IV pilus assembly protein PilA
MFGKRVQQMGFTLIEILVVITIIGILLAAGSAAFVNAQKSARDNERTREVTAISQALEQYYGANGNYGPVSTNSLASLSTYLNTTYLPNGIPTAPTGGGGLAYTFSNDSTAAVTASKFCVCTNTLEQPAKSNAGALNAAGVCDFANAVKTQFCTSNKQ